MSIGWGTILYGFAAGTSAGIALILLLIGARRRFDMLMASFGVFALVSAAGTLVTVRLHRSTTVDDYVAVFRLFGVVSLLMAAAMFVLVVVWTAAVPRWAIIAWALATVLVGVLQVGLPNGLLTGEIEQLRTVTLVGEEFVVHVSGSSAWRPVLDVYLIGSLALIGAALFRGFRTGHRANAAVVSTALVISMALGMWDSLVDAGRVGTPYLAPFGALIASLGAAAYLAERNAQGAQRLRDQTTLLEELVVERSSALLESNRLLQRELERHQLSAHNVALLTEEFEESNALIRSSSADVDASLTRLLDLLTTILPAVAVELELELAPGFRVGGNATSRWARSSHEHSDDVPRSTPDLTEPIRIETRTIGEVRAWAVADSDPAFADPQYLTLVAEHLASLFHRLELVRKATVSAVQDDRQRIAMDLHDSVSQRMYSVSFLTDALVHLVGDDPSAVTDVAERVRELVLLSLAELRSLLFELQPKAFDELGLDALIAQLADNTTSPGMPHVATGTQPAPNLPTEVKIGLYRIAQEALNNACRHSNGEKVHLSLSDDNGVTTLEVSDDGIGFLVDDVVPGHGLGNLRTRAADIGVELQICSTPGGGTTIEAHWADPSTAVDSSAQSTPA